MNAVEANAVLASGDKQGYAAVAIINVEGGEDGEMRFAWQRKTPGYPAEKMVGALCLFGGNREDEDATARETLARELGEELPAAFASKALASMKPFARYVVTAPKEAMFPKDQAYTFQCCVFEVTLPAAAVDARGVMEGKLEVLPLTTLVDERFCWAYNVPLADYLTERSGRGGGRGEKGGDDGDGAGDGQGEGSGGSGGGDEPAAAAAAAAAAAGAAALRLGVASSSVDMRQCGCSARRVAVDADLGTWAGGGGEGGDERWN